MRCLSTAVAVVLAVLPVQASAAVVSFTGIVSATPSLQTMIDYLNGCRPTDCEEEDLLFGSEDFVLPAVGTEAVLHIELDDSQLSLPLDVSEYGMFNYFPLSVSVAIDGILDASVDGGLYSHISLDGDGLSISSESGSSYYGLADGSIWRGFEGNVNEFDLQFATPLTAMPATWGDLLEALGKHAWQGIFSADIGTAPEGIYFDMAFASEGEPAPVPLAATGPFLIAGVGALVAAARRKRRAA